MWTLKMYALRQLLDANNPVVFAGSWDRLSREGWRWAMNLDLVMGTGEKVVKDYLQVHGPTNVTVGHAFDSDQMKPVPNVAICGLYVRDVDIQTEQMAKLLEDDKAIERWLESGKASDG